MLTVTDIALNRLVPSTRNVRRTGNARIDELAASIAAHGLLQNLTVVETSAKGKKAYEVIAGGRRLAACKLLAKQKQLAANAPIACHVITEEENVTELSLAENALQCAMHPSDQFDAFHALHTAHGMSAEDIAARFGVTAAVVRQRLKLACVSPKLIEAYRQDEMNLDQLTAFTVTDDQAKQEEVWEQLGGTYDRGDLIVALRGDDVSASDPVARFVTQEAYEAAGGIIVCDLFDTEGGGFFANADRLDDLARAKLEALAAEVRAEGWLWVTTMRRFDYAATAGLRRVYPQPVPLSAADQERFAALEGEHDRLLDQTESEAQEAALQRLENELDALRGEDVFAPEDIARAGAFVTVGHDGSPRIERGFVRPEDAPGPTRKAADGKSGPPALSAALVRDLTAHQTMCLRVALAENTGQAMVALTHALASALFLPHAGNHSCLDITTQSRCLEAAAPGIAESPAGQRLTARHEAWARRLPQDAAALWGFIGELTEADRLALLAHSVALSVDAVRQDAHTDEPGVPELAQAVALDMRADWQPTAANYFSRVSRDRILEAVREGVSPEAADNLAKLKKAAVADAAERRLQDKGWLPPILRLAAPLATHDA